MQWRVRELERQTAGHARQIKMLRKGLAAIKETVEDMRTWAFRLLVIVGWWASGTFLNLTTEQKANLASELILHLLGR
jgi:hypothetical protein